MAYGLSASAVGKDFPWIFNPPATYWDGLSMIFKYIGEKEGGLEKLKGKTIGFIFLESGYGREPMPLLEDYAKQYGFTVKEYRSPARKCRTSRRNGYGAARPPGLDDHVGLGRDEPDRGQASLGERLSAATSSSASGGRAARTTPVRPAPAARAISA